MTKTSLVYGVDEVHSKISAIQSIVKSGLIIKVDNKNAHENNYIVNQKILESIIDNIEVHSVIDFDEDLKVYTAFNDMVPQIYGEGTTEVEAIDCMVAVAKTFAKDYFDNIDLFSDVFNGIQQFLIGNILLNMEDDIKIREILKIA